MIKNIWNIRKQRSFVQYWIHVVN